ncbi:hypothetical protein MKX96_04865 [Psychrobacillus sp. FSL W7-1493]|uniref:hypothetical protein n=1 Tax=Psychrobacillus sp. FSL W7-1493 TaxID=2921552 RepID=UPI0030FC0155
MNFTVTGHEMNQYQDMKKLDIVIIQAMLNELQKEKEKKRKIIIVTSSSYIVTEKINTEEPDKKKLPLLERAVLESEEVTFRMENQKFINMTGMIVLNDVEIIPFTHPDKVMKKESFILFTDHILGITLSED